MNQLWYPLSRSEVQRFLDSFGPNTDYDDDDIDVWFNRIIYLKTGDFIYANLGKL